MKESTKNEKAIAKFKEIARKCKVSFITLVDSIIKVAGTEYKAVPNIHTENITVYEIVDDNNSIKIDSFTFHDVCI